MDWGMNRSIDEGMDRSVDKKLGRRGIDRGEEGGIVLSSLGNPFLAVLSRLSCSGCPVLTVLR